VAGSERLIVSLKYLKYPIHWGFDLRLWPWLGHDEGWQTPCVYKDLASVLTENPAPFDPFLDRQTPPRKGLLARSVVRTVITWCANNLAKSPIT